MRHSRRGETTWIFLAALALAFGDSADGQQTPRSALVALVTDAKTGAPISSAEVVVAQLRRIALTDSIGKARLDDIPAGIYDVRVRHIGYRPRTSEVRIENDAVTTTFSLEPVALQLDTVVKVAERPEYLLPKAFETRRKMGIGRFLTAEQLETEANREFALVAMTRFPGLRVVSDASGRLRVASARGNCGAGTPTRADVPRLSGSRSRLGGGGESGPASSSSCFSSRPCFVRMFLDNMDLGEYEFDIVRTWDLAGVEYYTGASMPAQYRLSGTACGVLLLWSKR